MSKVTTEERTATMVVRCRMCNTDYELKVREEDAHEYFNHSRRHIQDIFPYLSPAERELLISQTCSECWDKMFGTDEDEEDLEGKHYCKYCGDIVEGENEDVLCDDCKQLFGHSLYSEL